MKFRKPGVKGTRAVLLAYIETTLKISPLIEDIAGPGHEETFDIGPDGIEMVVPSEIMRMALLEDGWEEVGYSGEILLH